MSDLQKYEAPANRIAQAMQAPKIRSGIDRPRLVQIYRKALALAGHRNFDPEQISIDITLLTEVLQKHFAGITINELAYISEKGAIGEYGEFHGINPATFAKWIREYLDSHERKEAVRSLKTQPKQLDRKKELTRDEKQDIWSEAKDKYQKTGQLVGELFLYDIGIELGYIDLNDEMLVEEVKFKAQKWFENERLRLIEVGGLTRKHAIGAIKKVLELPEDDRKTSAFWVNRCKRIAVSLALGGMAS